MGAATLVSATYAAASTAAASRSKVTGFGSSLGASYASAILVFAIGSSGSI